MHPTKGDITQEFGAYPQASGEAWGHTGRDYAGNVGDDVVTIADGVVLFADWSVNMSHEMCDRFAFVRDSPNSGIVVLIEHEGWWSVSAHLDETHLLSGQKVERGDRVGALGNTGRTFGAHLHYECIDRTGVYTPLFGRYDPALQIAHEDIQATPKPLATPPKDKGFLMALNDKEQNELLEKVRELHRDYSQGISGVRHDGDSFRVIRDIASKIGVRINEATRAKKYGKK